VFSGVFFCALDFRSENGDCLLKATGLDLSRFRQIPGGWTADKAIGQPAKRGGPKSANGGGY